MAINSRRKGQQGEKKAIAFFKEWTGMDFKRSPASGGLRGHVAEYTVGDIVCVEKNYIFPLSIEVKSYEKIDFSKLLIDNHKSKILDYWDQCYEDAERAEKFPILLMRYNGLPANFFFVAIAIRDYQMVKAYGLRIQKERMFIYNRQNTDLLITNTDQLSLLDWKKFEEILKLNLKERWQKNQ